MNIKMVVPGEYLLYASSMQSLEDIAKTEACKNKYVHCTFDYSEYETERIPLERDLQKLGVVGLLWGGTLKVSLNKPNLT